MALIRLLVSKIFSGNAEWQVYGETHASGQIMLTLGPHKPIKKMT